MTDIPNWFELLGKHTQGLPQVESLPVVDVPDGDLPSASRSVTDMSDGELAANYDLVSKYKAAAEYAAGLYGALEISCKSELQAIKNRVYVDLKKDQEGGKFKNKEEAEILVSLDPRVEQAEERYLAMRQGRMLHESSSSSYGQYALTYAGERKDRREREANRRWRSIEERSMA